MAIPSGAGTEVLKASYMHALTDTGVSLIAGDAIKIRTILSIVFCEMGTTAETVNLYVDAGYADVNSSSGQDIFLLHKQPLPSLGTFVFSEKIVIYGLDALKCFVDGGGNVDVHISYIEQDWT